MQINARFQSEKVFQCVYVCEREGERGIEDSIFMKLLLFVK